MTPLLAIYIVAPIGVYLILSWLSGHKAVLGFAIAGAGLAALWLAWALTVSPLFTGDGRQDVYPLAWAVAMTGAVALAGIARVAGNAVALKVFGVAAAVLVAVPALMLLKG